MPILSVGAIPTASSAAKLLLGRVAEGQIPNRIRDSEPESEEGQGAVGERARNSDRFLLNPHRSPVSTPNRPGLPKVCQDAG